MKRFLIIIGLVLLATVHVVAQVSVSAKLDSVQILVGSQTHLKVSVSNGVNANIEFPSFKDEEQMGPGIEVVRTSNDTTGNEINRTYTLTVWDEGKYTVPALDVKVNGKDYKTNAIPLTVNTIKVDTAHTDSIRPMREVVDVPYSWEEWSPLFWLSIVVLLILVIIYYLYVRLRAGKPIISRVRFIRRLLPHEKAMQKIEKIKADHLGEDADQKEYYTELTDTLRQYLEDRFGIKAKEMTSSEIINRLENEEDKTKIDELREVFRTADLVKFAKYSVQDNINDLYLTTVVQFIDSTKEDDAPKVEKVGTKLSEKDRTKMRRRKGVRFAIALLVIVATAILAYIVWRAVQLIG